MARYQKDEFEFYPVNVTEFTYKRQLKGGNIRRRESGEHKYTYGGINIRSSLLEGLVGKSVKVIIKPLNK